MDREFEDRLLAKLYGIPKCCVDYYCNNRTSIRSAPALTGGIRLCPACAKTPKLEYIRTINKERICPRPFPDTALESDLGLILNDQNFSEQEREWLGSNTERFIERHEPNDPVSILRTHIGCLERLTSIYRENTQSEPDVDNVYLSLFKMKVRELETKTIDAMYLKLKSIIQAQQKNGLI